MDAAAKLRALRKSMSDQMLDGYLQPVHDEYMSEYPPVCNRRVQWLCGFAGSAGTVAVMAQKAAIFVDGRYTLQAKNEVDGALFEQHNVGAKTPENWFAENAASGARIGYDPKLYTRSAVRRLHAVLEAKNIEPVPVSPNPVDALWQDRPATPASQVFIHEARYAGESSADKRARMAKEIAKAGADVAVISSPEAVCWLLNIRGRDVESTPLALSVATLDAKGHVRWYIAAARCDEKVRAHLGNEVELRDPGTLEGDLVALGKKAARVLCDPQVVPVWFMQILSHEGAVIVEGGEPCLAAKSVKNTAELQGIRNAHIRDGVAVTKLLAWLAREAVAQPVREMEVCDKLLAFRAADASFVEPSFATISGSGAHGAIVHYRVSEESDRALQTGELFLLDSGGQYPGGTTDITRTVAIGTPTAEHKDRFTRVLRGHIALACALFPEGTGGSQLDALARQYLWQDGLDYDHGTGHGVGCFLGVHEGPQRISKRGGDAPLKAGMIVSNEPGYYKTGAYGIRIENLVAVTEKNKNEQGKATLGFETLTCVPIDTGLVDTAMLSAAEKAWLNAYHAWVLHNISPLLDAPDQQWLAQVCSAIT